MRELCFPFSRRKFDDLPGRVDADPLQYIDQVSVRVDTLKSAGDQQALDNPDPFGADLGPTKEPVLFTHGDRPQTALQMIGVDRNPGITVK